MILKSIHVISEDKDHRMLILIMIYLFFINKLHIESFCVVLNLDGVLIWKFKKLLKYKKQQQFSSKSGELTHNQLIYIYTLLVNVIEIRWHDLLDGSNKLVWYSWADPWSFFSAGDISKGKNKNKNHINIIT